jgi:hypothetical protein
MRSYNFNPLCRTQCLLAMLMATWFCWLLLLLSTSLSKLSIPFLALSIPHTFRLASSSCSSSCLFEHYWFLELWTNAHVVSKECHTKSGHGKFQVRLLLGWLTLLTINSLSWIWLWLHPICSLTPLLAWLPSRIYIRKWTAMALSFVSTGTPGSFLT